MATFSSSVDNNDAIERYAHVVGWGMAVPESALTNDELSTFVETSDEWIFARTGIRQRYIADEGESTATLAYKAAQQALEVADILPTDLDLIVVATSTPENIFPSTASLVQDWLNAHEAGAFDLSAACSGFVYALNMAADSIRAGSIQAALGHRGRDDEPYTGLAGSQHLYLVRGWRWRRSFAGERVPGGVLSSVLRSDGAGSDLLAIPSVGSIDADASRASTNGNKLYKMYMAGSEVFRFATRVISESIEQTCSAAGVQVKDIDLVIPHQANLRILQAAARKLGLDADKFMSNVERYGNTSAASIPIALCEAIEQQRVQDKDSYRPGGFRRRFDLGGHADPLGCPGTERAARLNVQPPAAPCSIPDRQVAVALAPLAPARQPQGT